MSHHYLEITYRNGKAMAAYLYLPRRPGDKSSRVHDYGNGYLADLTVDGRPIGIEITAPSLITINGLNSVLSDLHLDPLDAEELSPLVAS